MANASSEQQKSTTEKETVSRRVAEELHDRIDQAAEKGDRFEHKLHEGSAQVQERTRELKGGVDKFTHDNPWLVVGGSVVLGFIIGTLASRR